MIHAPFMVISVQSLWPIKGQLRPFYAVLVSSLVSVCVNPTVHYNFNIVELTIYLGNYLNSGGSSLAHHISGKGIILLPGHVYQPLALINTTNFTSLQHIVLFAL